MQPVSLQCARSEYHTDIFIYFITIVLTWCPPPLLTEREINQNTSNEQGHQKVHFYRNWMMFYNHDTIIKISEIQLFTHDRTHLWETALKFAIISYKHLFIYLSTKMYPDRLRLCSFAFNANYINNLCVCVGGGGSLMAKVCDVDWGYVGLCCDRVAPKPGCFTTTRGRGGGIYEI